MSRHKWLATLGIAAALGIAATGMGAAPVSPGPPLGWEGHPPIHARPYTTSSPTGYSPAQVRHAYGFDKLTNNGAGQTIAIVDAYDDPTALSDLNTFSSQFGLPTMTASSTPWFQKAYPQGSQPSSNGGWALEISLDIQWAHAIAPQANILLVEAASNSFSNLFGAVDYAAQHAQVVSMSWGGSDFSGESLYDYHFNPTGKNVVFTASSGDSGGVVNYPAASPYVISVGGTSLPLDGSGNLSGSETAWSGSGGGPSAYESEPGYQSSYPIPNANGKRGTPDVSYDADPNTGFSVYDSTPDNGQTGWWQVGGTSAGAPQWAAMVALADQASGTALSTGSLTSSFCYTAAKANYAGNFRDIKSGTAGSYSAATGYDFVTGLGSPLAAGLVPAIAGGTTGGSQDFSISVSPTSQSAMQGSNASYTVTLTPMNGFTGTVNLSASGLPAGTSASFSPSSPTISSTTSVTSTLTATTSSTANTGSYSFTVTGTSGNLTHSVSAGLSVTSSSAATTVSVSAINYSFSGRNNRNLQITVNLVNNLGAVVPNASVSIITSLNGTPYASGTGITGSTGSITFTISRAPTGTYTTTVTSVSASGLTWDGVTPYNSFTK